MAIARTSEWFRALFRSWSCQLLAVVEMTKMSNQIFWSKNFEKSKEKWKIKIINLRISLKLEKHDWNECDFIVCLSVLRSDSIGLKSRWSNVQIGEIGTANLVAAEIEWKISIGDVFTTLKGPLFHEILIKAPPCISNGWWLDTV